MDLFEKCSQYTYAREAQAQGSYPYFVPFEDSEGTELIFQGRRILMMGSNNYLGLTTDPRVREASAKAVQRYGTSCTGSRFMNGTLTIHGELEARLANFVGKEDALVFTTGYQVNLGVISCLVGRRDVVIADKDSHASVIDGCLLAPGEMRRFSHNDPKSLEQILSNVKEGAGKLVVVEGVYSMGGDVAPLPEVVEICKRHGARLMVDDAHGFGVMGQGRGTVAHFCVTDKVDLIMGTFSKSFASIGGFIAGDSDVLHYVAHHGRAFAFSASLPAGNVAAVLKTLEIMETEPERIQQLWKNVERMRAGLKSLGYNIGSSTTPVIPIIIGDDERTLEAWKLCFEAGVYVNAVLPPGVPMGNSILRTSYMATHTDQQIDHALDILSEVGRKLNLI
jgi:8-amino-7-oxononanoate synthase